MFHIFCDGKGILEAECAPTNPSIVAAFISALAGSYFSSAVSNYVCSIKAWHTIHGQTWTLSDNKTEALLKAALSLAPPHSKRLPREPYTVQLLVSIRNQLDLMTPLHVAIFACLTTVFYAMACTGELTTRTLCSFNPLSHVKPSNIQVDRDCQGNWITNLHLPKMKSVPDGEDINWARQEGPSDPLSVFENHLAVNAPSTARSTSRSQRKKFLLVLASTLKDMGKPPLQGHSIHIGSTLEYLLRNIPFDIVKVKGRWGSDAFLVYLCCHAQILTPYMQAQPVLHESFLHITLPPVR
ncbi:hypothetical protein BS17DRAFT_840960 [Gyrodon lividus]|nr:hypothetical protein BS17DRAFT_840960 [Gyrodon lividus]